MPAYWRTVCNEQMICKHDYSLGMLFANVIFKINFKVFVNA